MSGIDLEEARRLFGRPKETVDESNQKNAVPKRATVAHYGPDEDEFIPADIWPTNDSRDTAADDVRRVFGAAGVALMEEMENAETSKTTDAALITMAKKRHAKYVVLTGGDVVLLFGRWAEKRLSELSSTRDGRDYLRWMMKQEFPVELLTAVRECLART